MTTNKNTSQIQEGFASVISINLHSDFVKFIQRATLNVYFELLKNSVKDM